ncbi:hypothetical protein ESA94_04775 [Lacibacter luteus]|uniref:Uncharacterized protein n=1 Tax=Lacibacter luteus TaxID=2508719 RepID=A0A4Q1CNX9_9BACT|nr:hypothetical protein [Lacibacter luteus]RXK62329.1 hypothetical protein ESA94_04775 [Lacibacter luteus]
MKHNLLTFALFFLYVTALGQVKKDLNIKYKLRGQIYAHSSIEDTTAAGGFGSSDNLAKQINDSIIFDETGIFLKIDTTKIVSIADKFNGYNLFLGNKTDTILKLEASDSRLSIIAEAFYKNEWQAIEYLPSSWCGNSYHNVYLKTNQFWAFVIPRFTGKIKTKIRYKLLISKGNYIYSNEINASINKGQLTEKQGHKSQGLMDPYID